jgi:hypothetical protein
MSASMTSHNFRRTCRGRHTLMQMSAKDQRKIAAMVVYLLSFWHVVIAAHMLMKEREAWIRRAHATAAPAITRGVWISMCHRLHFCSCPKCNIGVSRRVVFASTIFGRFTGKPDNQLPTMYRYFFRVF